MAPLLFFTLFLCFSHFVSSKTTTYIVLVQKESKPSVFSEAEHWYQSTLQSLHSDESLNPTKSETNLLLHVYNTVFSGFSAKLTSKQAALLSNQPGVTHVIPDRVNQLHTTRSPYLLGLYSDDNYKLPGNLLSESESGSNVTVGMIDTGIWPEHPSFNDQGMRSIPSKWKGICQEGQNFTKANCNKKIIGARFFVKGIEAAKGQINASLEFRSTRDTVGHGTHTSSTAAGRAVENASLFGYAKGTAVGVAPKARIAVYKVCWLNGCMDSDILSAMDKAVEDGVEIISISIGYRPDYRWSNIILIAIAAYGAMERGVFVSAAAGNSGPDEYSIGNAAPWVTTVGASTTDRRTQADLVLGDGQVLKSSSVCTGMPMTKNLTIVFNGYCTSFKEVVARGKMVVCLEKGLVDFSVQEANVMNAGGAAIVIVAHMGLHDEDFYSYHYTTPGITVNMDLGHTIFDYIEHSGSKAFATVLFRGTVLGIKPAPMVASFSSRGPTTVTPYILKPDLIAPGVNILAAWNYGMSPTGLSPGQTETAFYIDSGTSMACPHISGVAALLKGAHPEWTPAMIRSAMMTTTYTEDNLGQPILDANDYTTATVWAMGAGHVDPQKAVDPGLVYDISPDDYFNFLCASKYSIEGIRTITNSTNKSCGKSKSQPWNLNYPAITVDFKAYKETEIVFTRTVTHVSKGKSVYTVEMVNPNGVQVTVNPVQMKFNGKGQKQDYNVSITAQKLTMAPGNSTTDVGKIVWSDGKRNVVSPVVVMWQQQVY